MTGLYDLLVAPFVEFDFMARALVASLALALGCAPVGVLLLLRRMSLVGDTMSHAVLPGAAVGFLISGFSLPAMSLGGFAAGLAVALLAGLATRLTDLKEDASFASFYLISLALGVMIVSTHGSSVDLLHVLFGTVLSVDDTALVMVAGIASATVLILALIWRPLVVECFDPGFLRSVGGPGGHCHLAFLVLVVLNLVGGFQALGTLMAVGLMMLPAAAARFWTRDMAAMTAVAFLFAFLSGWLGLALSFRFDLPSGPTIILGAGGFYLVSLAGGTCGSLRTRYVPGHHLRA
jgi:zinc/manganese transport system permease protein